MKKITLATLFTGYILLTQLAANAQGAKQPANTPTAPLPIKKEIREQAPQQEDTRSLPAATSPAVKQQVIAKPVSSIPEGEMTKSTANLVPGSANLATPGKSTLAPDVYKDKYRSAPVKTKTQQEMDAASKVPPAVTPAVKTGVTQVQQQNVSVNQ